MEESYINVDFKGIDDTTLITNLISGCYDIFMLKSEFIVYCMFLIHIQIKSFELMFEKDDLSNQFLYYDNVEFKNNENDLLKLGEMVKILHPFGEQLKKEIIEKRKMTEEEFNNIQEECKKIYINKKN